MDADNKKREERRVKHYFDHEQMDVYRVAKEVALWVNRARFHKGCADLRDQAVRASRSVVLNIAEGRGRGGNAGRNHYRIALGSAAETCAALDLAELDGGTEQQDKLRRVGAMLGRLTR